MNRLRPLAATGMARMAATYAAVAIAVAALFFFLHWIGNQLPYDLARQRLADEIALNAGPADERFFDGAKPLFTWEFCELSLMTLAGANRGWEERAITDAILLQTFRMTRSIPGGDTDRCAETRAAAEGVGLIIAIKKTRYPYGNKAALAISLRWLSIFDYHRLLLFASYGAWVLLSAALAALGWRALAVGAPIIALGVWMSGIVYFADAANGPAYVWAVLSAAILALMMRWNTTARRASIFCFIAGMASAYLWFADGHNAIAVFLTGLVAWLGYSRLGASDKARRAAGCAALWILGGAAALALMLTVKTAAAELSGEYYDRNQEFYHDASVAGRFFAQVGGRLSQAWAETPAGDRGAPELACPGCAEGGGWRNLPIARDVRGLWLMTPLRESEDRALLLFSVAALAAAAGFAAWSARRGERKPARGVLWVGALTALASAQFFLPTDVDFRNARLAFVPLSAGWVALALAAAESERESARAWALAGGVALLGIIGVSLAHPAYAWALEREIARERPAVRAKFDVYLNEEDRRIIYKREDCAESDVAPGFFLWIFPMDKDNLPEYKRETGFESMDFGGRFDVTRKARWTSASPHNGRCLMARALPTYPIARIITGQLADGGAAWEADLAGDMRVPDGEPTASGGIFDIYKEGGRIIYAAADCAESDTRGRFLLSVFPVRAADLSDDSKARGLEHDSLNFDFARHGAVWDGACAAAIPLPSYEIAEIKTGQFTPGEGELWRADIAGGAGAPVGDVAARVPDGEPAARGGGFDIYIEGGKIIYAAAEDCDESDTRARFFLSVFPARTADLSDDSKALGRDHDALNFDFENHGAIRGGACVADVSLPSYEVAAIETGQFIPGGSELWRVGAAVGD